jgi:hypothetical protein
MASTFPCYPARGSQREWSRTPSPEMRYNYMPRTLFMSLGQAAPPVPNSAIGLLVSIASEPSPPQLVRACFGGNDVGPSAGFILDQSTIGDKLTSGATALGKQSIDSSPTSTYSSPTSTFAEDFSDYSGGGGESFARAEEFAAHRDSLSLSEDSSKSPRSNPCEVPVVPGITGWSCGSHGHPDACGPACKYAKTKRGCKDGAACSHCHFCVWHARLRGSKRCRGRGSSILQDQDALAGPNTPLQ